MNKRLFAAVLGTVAIMAAAPSFGQGAVYEDWCLRIDDQVVNDAGVKGTVVRSHWDAQDEEYDVKFEDGSTASYVYSEMLDRHDPMPKLIGRSHKTYDAMHGLSE